MPINQHNSSPQKRLANLMAARLAPGADKEKIDRRIWDSFGEKWCVMFTDLSGFSRGTEKFGIIHFMQIIFESERLVLPIIDDFDGLLVKSEATVCWFCSNVLKMQSYVVRKSMKFCMNTIKQKAKKNKSYFVLGLAMVTF